MIPSSRIRRLHFVGIGGSGMSGIAEILHRHGFTVTGSDRSEGPVINYLRGVGIEVFLGHAPSNIEGNDVLVRSSAVGQDNPEVVAALEKNIPVIRRAEMLGELMRLKYTIAVAGTHGKTTTTSMLGSIWSAAGRDPTVIVGGIVRSLGTGAQLGEGDALIAEADEYDRSFLDMVPSMALVTNVDADHLDCYGTFSEIQEAFVSFLNKVPFYGQVIACLDEPGLREILPRIRKPLVTYGFSLQADYRAENIEQEGMKTCFDVIHGREVLGRAEICLPGRHNIKNALGSLALAVEEGIEFSVAVRGLAEFVGVKRRFEYLGDNAGLSFYDDYAHHPTEVEATLVAAREGFPGRKVAVVFQPHLYSRTRDHAAAFSAAFLNCDLLIVTDIFGAREEPIEGVRGEMISDGARKLGHGASLHAPTMEAAAEVLRREATDGTLVLQMGAGSIWRFRDIFSKAGGKNA